MHNLKNIDLDIPRDKLVVFTGPSGSGKSSLAFDTLFAEGQRQYVESLSVYARQFLQQMERPDVDLIDGLAPTICIDQRPGSASPRSTVATVTEIYDYLRLLMARLGEPSCYRCGSAIRPQSADQIAEKLFSLAEGTKVMLLAPLVRGRKGEHREVVAGVRKAQIVKVRVDGDVYDIDTLPEIDAKREHVIEAVVDRLVIRPGVESRLTESLQLAVKLGEGLVVACVQTSAGTWRDEFFSTLFACPDCGLSFAELAPRTFSFNSPYGACPTCAGLGYRVAFDPEMMGGDEATLAERLLQLEKDYATATDPEKREKLEKLRGPVPCLACRGTRLRPEAASVRLGGKAIFEITRLAIGEARRYFLELAFTPAEQPISTPIIREISRRLEFLERVGVDYLALDRAADTLSGGELQRVRLAAGIGSGLVGVCYVLDEPSLGLHPRDNQRLIDALRELQQQGNSVIVVEHDEAMMRAADYLFDFGPGAGTQGGQVVSQGTPAEVMRDENSLTGRYLSGQTSIPVPAARRKAAKSRSINIEGVTTNNLKGVDAWFPLGTLICVTGVSGSGKSSLINETLCRALARRLGLTTPKPGPHTSLRGASPIDKLVEIDQSPIGRTPRGNAATYTGAFDEIRKVFAGTREAKQLGYRASRFSFNAKSGRCDECLGHGVKKIEMNFLPDLYVMCNECGGARFNRQTLAVKYRGRSIADVLNLSIDEACGFFANFAAIARLVESLRDVGLGYLPLGQPSTTLSGGESQRIKLGTELARTDTGNTLYILDEPTTGLHFDDIRRLLAVLVRLVDRGNTVIVIEHNLDVIKCADWILDLGPEGGAGGGQLLACGTPEEIAALENNSTGRWLRRQL